MAELTIAAEGNVTLLRHEGSCRTATTQGTLTVQIPVPGTGNCSLATGKGTSGRSLPAGVSARVYASTGSVAASGLNFRSVIQTATTFSGVPGGGGASIHLMTGSGSISLKKLERQ
jgi:hypothetical protein